MQYCDFLTATGRINSMKVKEEWLQKHASDFYESVETFVQINKISCTRPVEKLWYYFNDTLTTISCKNPACSNAPKFVGLAVGFSEYCSSKCSNGSSEVKDKKVETSIKKYGVSNPYQAKEVIAKIRETNFKRYGVENPMHSTEIKAKMIERARESTGKDWALSKGGKADTVKRENSRKRFTEKYQNLEVVEYSEAKFGICTLKSKNCGHEFKVNKWQLHQRKKLGVEECTICNPIGSFSQTVWQKELDQFLTSHGILFSQNDRTTLGNLSREGYLLLIKFIFVQVFYFKNHFPVITPNNISRIYFKLLK